MEKSSDSLELRCETVLAELESRKSVLDRYTAKSRTGYPGFPFTWSSKMQTETASSTTKAELIALRK